MREGGRSELQTTEAAQMETDTRETNQHLAALCKALGHPVRVEIMRQLRERKTCACGDLVVHLPVAQSTVSQHLKVLRQAGLIRGSVAGSCTCYRIDHEALERFKALIIAI
jgi:ArsR family transcriptional regulator